MLSKRELEKVKANLNSQMGSFGAYKEKRGLTIKMLIK